MICLKNIKYYIANKLYSSNIAKIIPGYFRKKILKKENICFIPTILSELPKDNHPVLSNIENQKKTIKKFNETQKEVTAKTYPDLIDLLKEFYSKDKEITFLDFGGEQIDQYLILKKEFKNIKYYVFNLKQVNEDLDTLKKIYNYKNLYILKEIHEIQNHTYDFINFGSVLQYIDNYSDILKKILPTCNKHVLVSAVHLYKDQILDYKNIVKQTNLWPRNIHLFFFEFDAFVKIFLNERFQITFEKKNLTHDINYNNFSLVNLNKIKYTDILFEKII
jgi:putative methyltransferase (TIGR04325 family)